MTPILELQDLSFRYEGGLPGEKVLDALTFSVAPGERVGLVGCNGVGKSTLLKILVGILPIQTGALTVGGLPMERKNLAEIRRKVGQFVNDKRQILDRGGGLVQLDIRLGAAKIGGFTAGIHPDGAAEHGNGLGVVAFGQVFFTHR